jgi:hypothetical protein
MVLVLIHDNAHWCTAAITRALLQHFDWEVFDHPPYSPDLAPSDRLFTYLKNWLRSQHFNNNKLLEGVKMWLSSQVADFFDIGITETYFQIQQVSQFRRWPCWEVGYACMHFFLYNNFFSCCLFCWQCTGNYFLNSPCITIQFLEDTLAYCNLQ